MPNSAPDPGSVAITPRRAWWPAPSLRVRMVALAVAVALALQAILGLAVYAYQGAAFTPVFERRMLGRSADIAAELQALPGPPGDATLAEITAAATKQFSRPENYLAVLISPDGVPVASTIRPAPDVADWGIPARSAEPWHGRPIVRELSGDGDDHARVIALPMPASRSPGGVLIFATADTTYEEFMVIIRNVLLMITPVSAIATAVGCWLVFGRAMAPLRERWNVLDLFDPRRLSEELAVNPAVVELEGFRSELQVARERLREALRAQDRLISNISHELKTPIAVVLTEAQTLDRAHLTPDGREFVSSVIEEMRRLGRMINSFLSLSRLRAGVGGSGVRPLPLNEAVLDAVARAQSLASERAVTIATTLPEREASVPADEELLGMVLDVLVRRAVRATPAGGTVGIEVQAGRDRGLIRVRDAGAHIPPEQLARLFDHFSERQGPDTMARSSGVGLATAQGVAELHGGRIVARNLSTRGCEFTLELPAA